MNDAPAVLDFMGILPESAFPFSFGRPIVCFEGVPSVDPGPDIPFYSNFFSPASYPSHNWSSAGTALGTVDVPILGTFTNSSKTPISIIFVATMNIYMETEGSGPSTFNAIGAGWGLALLDRPRGANFPSSIVSHIDMLNTSAFKTYAEMEGWNERLDRVSHPAGFNHTAVTGFSRGRIFATRMTAYSLAPNRSLAMYFLVSAGGTNNSVPDADILDGGASLLAYSVIRGT